MSSSASRIARTSLSTYEIEEYKASVAMTPGQAVVLHSVSGEVKVAGATDAGLMVVEPGIETGTDHTFNAGESVRCLKPQPHCEVQMMVSRENLVSIGDKLKIIANGRLGTTATLADTVAVALETTTAAANQVVKMLVKIV